jgi:hypothetical protein
LPYGRRRPDRFETEIARYNRWREELTQSVHAYHDWLEANQQLDVQQSIRFYDLLENLNKGRLMLAFLAEFSRGKSELINALFFSSFKERLLPSDVGRTTMCPTEIFHDPSEEPYLKLLSVETRYRDESISQLKNMPVEWSKVRLNVNSAADMKKALKALADTKKVYALEARMLGLAPMLNEKGELPGEEELVEVPAWRYAMINYPHPAALQRALDPRHPGPERARHGTRAHREHDPERPRGALPAVDRHRRHQERPRDLGPLREDRAAAEGRGAEQGRPDVGRAQDAGRDREGRLAHGRDHGPAPAASQGAHLRDLRPEGPARQDPRGRGPGEEERHRPAGEIPRRRDRADEAADPVQGGGERDRRDDELSRASVAKRQQSNQAEVAELNGLQGKSREVVQKLWAKITAEKNAYNAALAEYKVNHGVFSSKRAALSDMLNSQKLDQALARSAQAIEDSWTTITLQRGMNSLVKDLSASFEAVFAASEDIKKLMQGVYNTFIEKFGFQKMTVPTLDLDPHRTKLKLLVHQTEAFVSDPVNVVVKEKHFVVKNFYSTLVMAARSNFTDAKNQTERWMQAVVLPLEVQIKDHKAQLQSRLDNLAKINEKTTSINEQMALLKTVEATCASSAR